MSQQPFTDRFGTDARPSAAEVAAQLERMLAAKCFVNAGRASKLLRYIVVETLEGRGDRLKGYSVAIEVFGREADFDAHSDPLVRVEAGRLRRRLIEYYADEGCDDPIVIEVPLGRYAVQFGYARRDTGDAAPPAGHASAATGDRRDLELGALEFRRPRFLVAAATILILLAATASILVGAHRDDRVELAVADGVGPPRVLVLSLDALPSEVNVDEFAAAIPRAIAERLQGLDRYVIADEDNWFQPPLADSPRSAGRQYAVTGNVRAAAGRLETRIRLVAVDTGEQLWSESFEAQLDSTTSHAIAESVAERVGSAALPYGPIFSAELARLGGAGSARPHVYECMLRYYAYRRAMDPLLHGEALSCFQAATQMAASPADAWAGVALLYVDEYRFGYNAQPNSSALERVRAALSRALAGDANNYLANLAVARLHYFVHSGDEFRHSAERVLEMRPDAAEALALLGLFFVVSGDSEKGLPLVDRAIDLTPNAPGVYRFAYVAASLREGRVREALAVAERLDTPNWPLGQLYLAAVAGLAGRMDVARAARQRLLALDPLLAADVASGVARLQLDPTLRAKLLGGLNAAGFDALASSSAD
jgi:adenylate cyclase